MVLSSWLEHIKKTRESGDMTYKAAMIAASKSWQPKTKKKGQTKKDKMDESKGMEGKTKGSKSKTKEDFTTDES